MGSTAWARYLVGFHAGRPGITEHILTRAADGGDAYDWLAAAVPSGGPVLDVACGNAPLWPRLPGHTYLGVDTADAELAAACARGATVVRADAAALPVADTSLTAVTCSMALQILTPLPAVLAEIRRVLAPGGRLVATVPDRHPLHTADLPVLAALLGALGRNLSYPNDEPLRRAPAVLAAAGLRLIADQRRRYAYRLTSTADADLFLDSLYLPDLPAARYRAARTLLHTLARARVRVPVPIRCIVAAVPGDADGHRGP
jgi:SAM-dependent methyltransferase